MPEPPNLTNNMNATTMNDKQQSQSHVFTRIAAFTKQFNGGNPAGVVVLPSLSSLQPSNQNGIQPQSHTQSHVSDNGIEKDSVDIFQYDNDQWMSQIGIEMGMSETSFVRSLHNGNDRSDGSKAYSNVYSIRWFCAPTGHEEHLCGHATLSAAYTLYNKEYADMNQPIAFTTKYSGILYAKAVTQKSNNSNDIMIELNFPAKPSIRTLTTDNIDPHLLHIFTLSSKDIVKISDHTPDLLIELQSTDILWNMKNVDFQQFKSTYSQQYRGVIFTSKAQQTDEEIALTSNIKVDFLSRFFSPLIGEDPVTGSAHCALCCYWCEKLNKHHQQLIGYQSSQRGGIVYCQWDEAEHRVILQGNAVTVIDGYLRV